MSVNEYLLALQLNMTKLDQLYGSALTAFDKLKGGHKESAVVFRATLSDIAKLIKKARRNTQLFKKNLPKREKQGGVIEEPEAGLRQTKHEDNDVVSLDELDRYF